MQRAFLVILLIALHLTTCQEAPQQASQTTPIEGVQSKCIRQIIEAVNEKDAEKYVKDFADSVQIFVASDLKIQGKANLKANRANHFKRHPNVKSAIRHLVEIDNKVMMHDMVWLEGEQGKAQDIIEIFTFTDGKISKVDVIQPKNLFQ
ncbi:MAG: nuclear transport factor 2 family protein [Bacteroidota bacterium]